MDEPRDDLKWFGEGFNGFPKTLPDDCVEYTIFIVDSKLGDAEKRQQLRQVQTAANRLTSKLLKDFIWQRDAFTLSIEREEGISLLRGRTEFGDSIEDEWLIVYLLRELSKEFPNTWTRVIDSDGQFLLVEAANALPKWLNPEIADFMLWMNNGSLLVIPLEGSNNFITVEGTEAQKMKIHDALAFIEQYRTKLLHLPDLQAEAFRRLQGYPKQIADSIQHALIAIPRKLAYVLHHNHAYISPAVEAFYLRDPIALRPLQTLTPTPLVFPPSDIVTVSIKFSRIGYAQLKSQQFETPASWMEYASSSGYLKGLQKAELGMKVACGFEMLVSDLQNQDKKAVREIKLLLEDVENGDDKLPTDDDIRQWGMREDDDIWLDIDFRDFEQELSGKVNIDESNLNEGFGDRNAQQNLRRIVENFGRFLQDDTAGAEGAEYFDDTDNDDDAESNVSSGSESADRDINFDEGQFKQMVQEMAGLPVSAGSARQPGHTSNVMVAEAKKMIDVSSDEEDEVEARKVMGQIERELHQAGALDLEPGNRTEESSPLRRKIIHAEPNGEDQTHARTAEDNGGEGEELDIDFNLAKNLLESFKSQNGLSGPGGNLMGLMGVHLPRNERDGT